MLSFSFLSSSDSRMGYIKMSILCFVIIGIWVLFALPIILYHVPQQQEVCSYTMQNVINYHVNFIGIPRWRIN